MTTLLPVMLSDLAQTAGDGLVELRGDGDVPISGASYDSRKVEAGDLFFCVPGTNFDGHLFAGAAAAAGARALCVERPTGIELPELVVRDVRASMPLVASRALGEPSRDLAIIGITGTNGKTTTTFLVESILRADGRTTGLVGTIETRIGEERRPGIRTTPESVDLHKLFAEMRDAGVDSVAMEVTSHALVLNRVDGIRFAAAAFTNLTQDHLDFHPDMEAYFSAKQSLFHSARTEKAAINVDDHYGLRIREAANIPVWGYGAVAEADVRALDVHLGADGSSFKVLTPKGETQIRTALVGPFNVLNCLSAITVCLQAGVGLVAIERGISALRGVPGRFESVTVGQPFTVVIDYAHTPDSLDNVLVAARRLASSAGPNGSHQRGADSDGSHGQGRVLCVFGCGGDRDRGKRPLMGMVAARLADHVVVTSDNPRSEDPEAIIGEILEGVITERVDGPDAAVADRRAAIALSLAEAKPYDVVVIAGKGHETGQQFADHTIPFDDRDVVREVLGELGWGVGE